MPGYHLDGSAIGIDAFFSTLREGNISPGRRILLEDPGGALRSLREAGVATLADLVAALKTAKKLAATAEQTGLSREYLTILRRQAQSWFPQPVALSRFPGATESLVERLASAGIKHTSHLFTAASAGTLPGAAHEQPDIDELLAMADLVRVPGVGPLFARAFVETGCTSVAALAEADPATLRARLSDAPALATYTGPAITDWDLRACIWFARLLSGSGAVEDPV